MLRYVHCVGLCLDILEVVDLICVPVFWALVILALYSAARYYSNHSLPR